MRIDAGALVGDRDLDVLGLAGESERHMRAAPRRRLAGVAHEVEQNLPDLAGEGFDEDVAGDA